MPDVSSNTPRELRMRATLDLHKRTIVSAGCPDDPCAG